MGSALRSQHSLLTKVISLIVVVAFLSNFILADAWAAVDIGEAPYKVAPKEVGYARLDIETFTVPAHLGEIKFTRRGKSRKFIVHIQDAHCNHFAQKKISGIIDYLNKEYGISAINLEGGAGGYNLDVFTAITGGEIRREVAEYFLKKGEINGAELYAINNPGKVDLWGIEDKDLYLENLKVYRDSLEYKNEVDKYLKELTHILNNLKRHIFNPELLKIDMAYNAYKAGNMDFRDYLEFLMGKAREMIINVRDFENLYLLSQAMAQEENIDFKKANTERGVLVNELKKGLSKNEVRELVTKTVDFKTKKIPRKVFYSYLLRKARELGLDIGKFPALSSYIVYVSTYEAVNRSLVMEELDGLEAAIKEPLYKNETQRRLDRLSRNLAILKNIFAITLTKIDYRYYLGNKSSFDVRNYLEFIKKQAPRYRIQARPDQNIGRLDEYRKKISKFYEYSFKRDDVFMENMRFGKTTGGMNGAVLMTGGFHTENLLDLFEKEKISYVSILPKFKIKKDYESPYFDILAGETPDIQQMLRSVIAQAAMLQVASFLSPAIAEAVWGEAGVWSFRAAVRVQEMVARKNKVILTDGAGNTLEVDGRPLEFGKGAEKTITLAQLLSEVGYTGEIRPEIEPEAEPPEEGPAIRAWQNAVAFVIAGIPAVASILAFIASLQVLPFIIAGVTGIQATLLLFQTYNAINVEKMRRGRAATPEDSYETIRRNFGPVLAPFVNFHEAVHRFTGKYLFLNRLRSIRGLGALSGFLDEVIAYAASYIAAPIVGVYGFFAGLRGMRYAPRVNELLMYDPNAADPKEVERSLNDSRWKEYFPERTPSYPDQNPRLFKWRTKAAEMIVPNIIKEGSEPGSNAYRIERKLGEGGFAAVFEGTVTKGDLRGGRVAIKIMDPEALAEGLSPDAAKESKERDILRFFQEYIFMQECNDIEEVVNVYDAGTYEINGKRYYYMVQELIEGQDLEDELRLRVREKQAGRRDEVFTTEEVLSMANQLFRGLKGIHEKGIIHGDIKPANMSLVNGKLKIADFGVSRYAPDRAMVEDRYVTGTPWYLPDLSVMYAKYGPKTDIFAAGVVLYQLMYERRLPFYTNADVTAKLEDLMNRGEYAKWADRRGRELAKEGLRLKGYREGSPEPTPDSPLEELIAGLLDEDASGIHHIDDAIKHVNTPQKRKSIAESRRKAASSRQRVASPAAPPVAVQPAAAQIDAGSETATVDFSAPAPADRISFEAASFFEGVKEDLAALPPIGPAVSPVEDIEVILPGETPAGKISGEARDMFSDLRNELKGVGDFIAGKTTTEVRPVQSLFANIFSGKFAPFNWLLRTLAVFSTPIHEVGHILASKYSGVQVDWSWRDLFTGEIKADRAPPVVRYGGIIGNVLASAVTGALLLYSLQSPSILTIALLSYIAVVNLASALAEFIGAAFGIGDIITPPAKNDFSKPQFDEEKFGEAVKMTEDMISRAVEAGRTTIVYDGDLDGVGATTQFYLALQAAARKAGKTIDIDLRLLNTKDPGLKDKLSDEDGRLPETIFFIDQATPFLDTLGPLQELAGTEGTEILVLDHHFNKEFDQVNEALGGRMISPEQSLGSKIQGNLYPSSKLLRDLLSEIVDDADVLSKIDLLSRLGTVTDIREYETWFTAPQTRVLLETANQLDAICQTGKADEQGVVESNNEIIDILISPEADSINSIRNNTRIQEMASVVDVDGMAEDILSASDGMPFVSNLDLDTGRIITNEEYDVAALVSNSLTPRPDFDYKGYTRRVDDRMVIMFKDIGGGRISLSVRYDGPFSQKGIYGKEGLSVGEMLNELFDGGGNPFAGGVKTGITIDGKNEFATDAERFEAARKALTMMGDYFRSYVESKAPAELAAVRREAAPVARPDVVRSITRRMLRNAGSIARVSILVTFFALAFTAALSWLAGRVEGVSGAPVETVSLEDTVGRLTVPVSREVFNEWKTSPQRGWFLEDISYEQFVEMQNNEDLKANLRTAIERMRKVDPEGAAEALRYSDRFIILPIPEEIGAQAMAWAEYRVLIISAKHLEDIAKGGKFADGLILVAVHEADHIGNEAKGITSPEKTLVAMAQEEERAYKVTLRWVKKLGDTPEQIKMQEFVTNHIKDNRYRGIIASFVTAGMTDVGRVIAIGEAVDKGTLRDEDEFLTAQRFVYESEYIGASGTRMLERSETIQVTFMREGILHTAEITLDGEMAPGTEIKPLSIDEYVKMIMDSDYALDTRMVYLASLVRQAATDPEALRALRRLTGGMEERFSEEEDEELRDEFTRLLAEMPLAESLTVPQIGKRAVVKRVITRAGKKYLEVETEEGRKKEKVLTEIELEEGNSEDLIGALSAGKEMIAERFRPILNAFQDALRQKMPALYTFSPLVGDLFGYASLRNGLIALNERITANPIAFIHEIGEYLIESGRLDLKLDGNKLIVSIDGKAVIEPIAIDEDALWQAQKDTSSPHYLLRSLQRQIFADSDVNLTEAIKIEQLAAMLDDRIVADTWTGPGMNTFEAAKGIRAFIKQRQIEGGVNNSVVVSYLDKADGKTKSFRIHEGEKDMSPIKLDIEDIQDLHYGRYVGAEMNVLVGKAAPGKSPEEVERFIQLSKMASNFLAGLTRSKLIGELRRITGNDTIEFEDLGRDVYITDHIAGLNKDVFKIEFQSKLGDETYTIAVATKTEKAAGDIQATEIRELQELQERPVQVVPKFGADKMWNGRRWYTEEFVEGKTGRQLASEGRFTKEMRKKIISTLLSIAVGLGGLAPSDIHGGNFVIREGTEEAVMVDIGSRRFRLIREASDNIEKEDARMSHKLIFLATLMSQYGFFEGTRDGRLVGSPEDNYFIFETIAQDANLEPGEGVKLLREAHDYYKDIHAKNPLEVAKVFSNIKWRAGFRNVFDAIGADRYAGREEMPQTLVPFTDLFMGSLGSYLAMVAAVPPLRSPPTFAPMSLNEDDIETLLNMDLYSLPEESRQSIVESIWSRVAPTSRIEGQQKIQIEKEAISKELDIPESIAGSTGTYNLKEVLGAGAFGVVVKGETPGGRKAAVKILSPDTDAHATIKFFQEYLVMRRLDKVEGALKAYEIGSFEMDGKRHYYIVQELADGGTLEEKMVARGDRPFTESEVQDIADQILKIINEIHENKILHIDLKPANLMFVNGKLKIGDFGIAAYAPEGEIEFGMGLFQGTPMYISEESMWDGVFKQKTDLYAIGVILYRLLNVEMPYILTRSQRDEIMNDPDPLSEKLMNWLAYRRDKLEDIKRSAQRPLEKFIVALLTENITMTDGFIAPASKGGIESAEQALDELRKTTVVAEPVKVDEVYMAAEQLVPVMVDAAKGAMGDLRGGVVDFIMTPMGKFMESAKSSVDAGTRRKFNRDYGTDTSMEGYDYTADMSNEELEQNLKKMFKEVAGKMSQPKYEDKKPRAIAFVPADKYDLAKKALSDVLKEMKLEALADRISIVKEANIADNGMVDEVMHVVSGKALLNYERFRKGDYPGEFGDDAQIRLANFLKALVMNPGAIDLASDPDVIDKILDGIVTLRMRRIDYEEIREWKSAQDEVLRSL